MEEHGGGNPHGRLGVGCRQNMSDEASYQTERQLMVDTQIARRGIRDQRVLSAMLEIPRHLFVERQHRHLAYSDGPLPIGSGQTISQPYIVALMSEQLGLSGDETVLEVGTGSGYQAAVLSKLASQVHSIERHSELAEHARLVLAELGLENVHVHLGDGTLGLPRACSLRCDHGDRRGPEHPPGVKRAACRGRAPGYTCRQPGRTVPGVLDPGGG